MIIKLHRIYEDNRPQGFHVLVDGIWPRGISKEDARLDDHWKELAPSDELRKWFNHDSEKWGEFRNRYLSELGDIKTIVKDKLQKVDQQTLVLLYGAKDEKHNHAQVLREYLEKLS
ncbi:DUF488 family protein [Salinimonas marina]|uniref:DUF488 family protein n=1 Tax=Salinimonas marina TaxID=2785918 RepID=A0A7S9DYQ8_9ALTE|nr:DUF488 family protein [Salinimonas marina]QPG06338.1 DUF488 family protein [Salinimonas marina]